MCEMSVLEGLCGKNTDKGGVAGGRVNAQAFSLTLFLDTPLHEIMWKRPKEAAFLVRIFYVFLWTCSKLEQWC